MAVATSTRLGPYDRLGDRRWWYGRSASRTRLERVVAIKILPSHLSSNAQARERFDREAKTISSLSHPHICQLYDVGHQDGVDFLVMEYLEDETLAGKLRKGPLPLEQVLRCHSDHRCLGRCAQTWSDSSGSKTWEHHSDQDSCEDRRSSVCLGIGMGFCQAP